MVKCYRCLKCSKIIECKRYNPAVLIEHLRTHHPEIELPDIVETLISEYQEKERPSANENYQTEGILSPIEKNLHDINIHKEETTNFSPEPEPIYTHKYKITTPLSSRSPKKRRRYRTSIEKWRPAKGLIYCPKCGANKKPIIKSRSDKLSYSTVGAACILTCWPFCLLPCIFQGPPKDYLHCAECHNFLGMYNKQRNCIQPNRNFVEGHQKQMLEGPFENNRHHEGFKVYSERKRVQI